MLGMLLALLTRTGGPTLYYDCNHGRVQLGGQRVAPHGDTEAPVIAPRDKGQFSWLGFWPHRSLKTTADGLDTHGVLGKTAHEVSSYHFMPPTPAHTLVGSGVKKK